MLTKAIRSVWILDISISFRSYKRGARNVAPTPVHLWERRRRCSVGVSMPVCLGGPCFSVEGVLVGRLLRFGLMGCGGLVLLVVVLAVGGALLGGGGGDTATQDPGGPTAPEEPGEPENESADPAPADNPEPVAPEAPMPFDLTGVGASATEPFQLESGLTIIRMSHQGSANFIVDLLDEAGTSVAPMGVANVIGSFEGSQAVQIPAAGQHLLNVNADGQWGFTIEQPRVSDASAMTSFSGNSKTATDLFALSGGLHRIELTHQGDANFIVDLLDENGASVVPMGITNEIGPFDGSQAVTVPGDGVYLLQVEANGPWTINID